MSPMTLKEIMSPLLHLYKIIAEFKMSVFTRILSTFKLTSMSISEINFKLVEFL